MPEIISNYIELHICHKTANGHEYLLLKRSDKNRIYPGIWQMITGGIEPGEATKEAVLRELQEETGITNAKIFVVPRVNTFYLSAIDKVCLCPVFIAITENKNIQISDEHSEYKWVSVTDAKELIHWQNQVESLDVIERFMKNEVLFNKLVKV